MHHLNHILATLRKDRVETVRFLKFCVVGASSFAVGFIVFNVFYALTHKLIFSSTLAYVLSVANGFMWNRTWTFHDRRGQTAWRQACKFAVANALGYGINLVAYTGFLAGVSAFADGAFSEERFYSTASAIFHGHAPVYSFLLVNAAAIAATAVVIAWNYVANRFWTFRK